MHKFVFVISLYFSFCSTSVSALDAEMSSSCQQLIAETLKLPIDEIWVKDITSKARRKHGSDVEFAARVIPKKGDDLFYPILILVADKDFIFQRFQKKTLSK